MAMSAGRDDGEPMMEMNTTPLIDVMLVLLVMFIITIPIQTHAVKIDLPPKSNTPPPPIKPIKNDLTITADNQIMWNGVPQTLDQTKDDLTATLNLPVEPELHFAPDPEARYELVDTVLATIKFAHLGPQNSPTKTISKMGFVGNENYTDF